MREAKRLQWECKYKKRGYGMKVLQSKKDIFTIPNLLSVFRMVLAVVMLWVFYSPEVKEKETAIIIILLISGLTDFLDGKIDRKFHMVSELGKIIDPIADKLTQGLLLICFMSRYEAMKIVFVLFLIKESFMAAAGIKVVGKTKRNEGAMWYGKVNTAVFYIVMFLLVFFPDIPVSAANILIIISGCFMLLAFVMYARKYSSIMKESEERI